MYVYVYMRECSLVALAKTASVAKINWEIIVAEILYVWPKMKCDTHTCEAHRPADLQQKVG